MVDKLQKIVSTHDMHFEYIIEDLMKMAFNNVVLNRGSQYKPIKTGRYKKSPVQSGNAAVACLLQYIIFESILRRKYYQDTKDTEKAYNEELWKIYKRYNKNSAINNVKEYFDELGTIRSIIAHAYLFEGYLKTNEEHRIVGLKEKAIGGQNKKRAVGRMTSKLRICTSPNQIGFKDAAIFYQTTNALLQLANLDLPYSLWKWDKTGEELEVEKWLNKAMHYLNYGTTKMWKHLNELIDEADYLEFMKGIETAGIDLDTKL